jgi:cell wall-associated NlpC family hydrolase
MPLMRSGASCIVLRIPASVLAATVLHVGRIVAVVVVGFVGLAVGLGGCVAVVGGVSGGPGSAASGAGAAAATGTAATADPAVPAVWEQLDQAAAATCAGLPWPVVAAIGRVESDSGRSTAPGVASGANAAGAEGPMQFEPATFAAYATVGPGGVEPPSPYDPVDAVYTAAAMLCANGAATASGLYGAVWDYDHDATYVDTVLVLADALGDDPALGSVPATALAFAVAQLGVPYLWGGTGDGGYDCSGLVQAAYRSAGVALPRVAQTQFDAGPAATPPMPGDLVFFGQSATDVSHVGIYVGSGQMIDAPYTGTVVRFDGVPTVPGTPWGGERYVGATAPG